MTNNQFIEKIKLAEKISSFATKFPESTYRVVLSFLLSSDVGMVNDNKQFKGGNFIVNTKRKSTNKKDTGKVSQKINDLISEGFFNEVKTIREVLAKLKLIGYPGTKITSLPSYLIPKLRSGELVREEVKTKNGKIYGYIRKNK